MKIGVFLFPESRVPERDPAILDEALLEARTAEELGADAVFMAEHHFDGNCVFVDPPTFAAALAVTTSKIKIGFAVLQASLYHPLRMAEQVALLDNLSKGRIILGLGRGSLVNEHEYAGFQVDKNEAQARLEEIEEILKLCFAGQEVAHKGRFWDFRIPSLRPRLYSKDAPLTIRGVASEKSLVEQAAAGRPVIIGSASNEATAKLVDAYRQAMKTAGHSDEAVADALSKSWVSRSIVLTETDEEAVRVGMPYVEQMDRYRASQSPAYQSGFVNRKGPMGPRSMLCGAPDTVRKDLLELKATGVGGVFLRFRLGPMPLDFATRGLGLIMREIAPELRT